jgi:tRNA (cmo5U34)-methyltransferase
MPTARDATRDAAMEDPIQRHPTRAEQLDILVTILADLVPEGGRVLDLGCGTGYVDYLLLQRRADLHLTGLDLKPESLEAARSALAPWQSQTRMLEANFVALDETMLAGERFDAAFTALVFHDLDDAAKQACIGWVAKRLPTGGQFLLYDRVRLTEPACFPMQQSIWRRIEREHGQGMRDAPDFDAYETDLASNNRPARLADYLAWLEASGFAAQLLHLHGNVMLMGGCKR